MAIPPGNKQVGQAAILIATAQEEGKYLTTTTNLTSVALVTDNTTNAQPPVAAKNAMIGTAAVLVASRAETNKTLLSCAQFNAIAIVRYDPPTSMITKQLAPAAIVTDIVANSAPPAPPKNIGIGQAAVTISQAIAEDTEIISTVQLVAVAIVTKFNPRHEHVTMNIEYAASAKLNTEDLL